MVEARKAGHSASEVSKLFGVSKRSVERFFKLQHEEGSISPKKVGGYLRSRLEGHEAELKRWIKQNNDATLAELRQLIRERLQIEIGTTALWHRLEALGLNLKKNAARGRTRSSGRPRRAAAVEESTKALG
jgi:transposase